MKVYRQVGVFFIILGLLAFVAMPFLGSYELRIEEAAFDRDIHRSTIEKYLTEGGGMSIFDAKSYITSGLMDAKKELENSYDPSIHLDEWQYKLGDWKIEQYVSSLLKVGYRGVVRDHPWIFMLLTFGMCIFGGVLYILPSFFRTPGIRHDGKYTRSISSGITYNQRRYLIYGTILFVLILGFFKGGANAFLTIATVMVAVYIVRQVERKSYGVSKIMSSITGYVGVALGTFLILFYIVLYWFADFTIPWTTMVDPVSLALSGNPASQWFLYGLLYTVVVFVMGVRMISQYRHNRYQRYRTYSVMFFQTIFAFLLPEMLVRLNYPYYDFKNMWPLHYSFYFDYNINSLMASGNLGMFMFVWGVLLTVVGVPVLTYFFGKRWYCSWVCGCGGLAETLGDPFRQLSDKSLKAWQYERYIIHAVLVFVIIMTIMVLYTYFTGAYTILGVSSASVRQWYGFLIGASFAGVVGTGFYPLMGNRMWCRYGCPLAAYLGMVQRFKSRFRITVNGAQCISCGNCSTYCEMGIDVRSYAQRGQHIVRSSCVGCGVCAAVCPRGVLKLENVASVDDRTNKNTLIHIPEADVRILR